MARSLRFEYSGAFYHVMARGNARGKIFLQDSDRALFLRTLGEACARTGWRVHAWVLLDNHYHLVLETPEPNLVTGMQWVQNAYTRRFNTRHRNWGRLFGDRYKAVPVEGAGYYYETLLDYVHLNPARARLVRASDGGSLRDYPWSSVGAGYALPPTQRLGWLAVLEGLAAFGCADTTAGRRAFVARLDQRARLEASSTCGVPALPEEQDRRLSSLRQGWYWGTQAFAERLQALAQPALSRARRKSARGIAAQQAHGEAEAARLLQAGLEQLQWDRAEVERRPGSDPLKVALATQIWERTTVNLAWISDQLAMRSAANASQQIRRHRLRHKSRTK